MKKVSALVVILVLMVSSCIGCGKTKSKEDYTIKIGVLSTADSIPLYVASQEKTFERNGCKVELVEFGSASDQSKAMEAGELDGMMTDMVVQCLVKKGGVDLKTVAIALGAEVAEGKFCIVASPNSKVNSIDNLAGSKVAISEGTMMEFLVDSYCDELGIDIDSIEKVSIPSLSLRYETLMEGNDVDCAILPEPLNDYALQNGAKLIIDDTTLQNNYSNSVIVLRDSFIKEQNELAQAFVKGYNEAIDNIENNPDKYKELALEVARVPEDMKDIYVLPHYTKGAVPTEETVDRIVDWMVKKGLLTEGYSYKELVTDELQNKTN